MTELAEERVIEPPSGQHESVTATELTAPELWNAFLARQPVAHVYHRCEWDRPFSVYGLKVRRLVALRGSEVVGILPLVCQKSPIFGRHLVSLPWFDTAGIVAEDEAARAALVKAAVELTKRVGVSSLDLREEQAVAGWTVHRADKVLMRLALAEDADALWKKFDPKVRNQVRKGEKSGLTVQRGGKELISEFYSIYATNMRDLGSPPHSLRFFRAVGDGFGEDFQIALVRHPQDGVIGGALTLRNGDRLEVPWASSLQKYNSLCVNHMMYWNIMQGACERKLAWLHFGRSTLESGTYKFKKQWGSESVPLHWYSLNRQGECLVDSRPLQESLGFAVRMWQRLPDAVSRLLGPYFIRQVS